MTTLNTSNAYRITTQRTFSPADYGFKWTDRYIPYAGTVPDWYEFDHIMGKRMALKARNAEVKRLRGEGWTVTTFSLGAQLVSKGGIGSGRPHIELVVNVYGFNAYI